MPCTRVRPAQQHPASPLPLPPSERNLFTRERNDGLYLVITYLLSKLFDELMRAGLPSVGISAYVFKGGWVRGASGG